MPDAKLLSDLNMKLIFERTRHDEAARDVDFLLSHIAAQAAEIERLRHYEQAQLVSRRIVEDLFPVGEGCERG